MKTALATLEGFEVGRALKKGQPALWQYRNGITGELRVVERAFGLGPSGVAEAMDRPGRRMDEAAA
jgi:hypothetical protein